ncbi:MAG: MBL fold metallo-hydrolase [Thermoplasmata archaeon]|nr:MBL fold metallo-hydrolase [Thermoplasmata archaeon]
MARRSPHFRTEEVAPGIHAALATDGGFGLCNGTILDLGGITVVVDAMLTRAAGLDLRRAAERLTGRRPAFLVNSHYHGDHTGGNGAFRGAHIVATATTRRLLEERSPSSAAEERAWARAELKALAAGTVVVPRRDRALLEGWYRGLGLATPQRRAPLPDLVIERAMTIAGSRRSVRILTYGGGHSPSDAFAYVPEDRLVILGDLLSIGYQPWLADGHPARLLEILDRVHDLGVDRAVPGHGDIGGARDIRRLQSYVRGLIDRAHRIRREGRRTALPEEIRPPRPFDAWKFASFYGENLAFVLRQRSVATAR